MKVIAVQGKFSGVSGRAMSNEIEASGIESVHLLFQYLAYGPDASTSFDVMRPPDHPKNLYADVLFNVDRQLSITQ